MGLEAEVTRGEKEKIIGKGGRSLCCNARVCVWVRGIRGEASRCIAMTANRQPSEERFHKNEEEEW